MGNANIDDEELVTTFVGAEVLVNNRPLTSHPTGNVLLIPNHFIYGQLVATFASDSVDKTQFNLKKRWRQV